MDLRKKLALKFEAIKGMVITISVIFLMITFNNSFGQQENQLALENNKSTVLAVVLSLQPY